VKVVTPAAVSTPRRATRCVRATILSLPVCVLCWNGSSVFTDIFPAPRDGTAQARESGAALRGLDATANQRSLLARDACPRHARLAPFGRRKRRKTINQRTEATFQFMDHRGRRSRTLSTRRNEHSDFFDAGSPILLPRIPHCRLEASHKSARV
jgi:hypothetical protein